MQIARNILIFNKFENRRLINCCKGLIWMYGTDPAVSVSAPVATTSQRDSASSELAAHKLSTTNKKTDSGYGASTVSSEDTEDDASSSSSSSSTTTVDDDMASLPPPPPVVVNNDDDLHQHNHHHHHHHHDEQNKTTPTTSIFVCGDYKSLESCRDIENELVKLDNRILRVKYSRMYEPSLEQIFTCIKSCDCVLIGNCLFFLKNDSYLFTHSKNNDFSIFVNFDY